MDFVTQGMLGLAYVICLPFALIGIFCYLMRVGVREETVPKDNHNPMPEGAKPPLKPPAPPPVKARQA
jgi:hypothetical protein